MKQLIKSLQVEKSKETQFTGGNICLSSCGQYLFCIYGSSVNVIDVNTGQTRLTLESEEEEISYIILSPNDRHLVTAHRNLLIKQWDYCIETAKGDVNDNDTTALSQKKTTSKCTRTWKAIHTAPISAMSFDTSSTLLATGSSDFTTKIWDIHSQYCTHNLKGAQATIKCIRFYPDLNERQQCVTACDQGKIRVYDLNTSKMDALLDSHYSAVTCIDYMDSDRLLSSSRDKVIIIWELKTWTKLRTIPIYESIESFILVTGSERMISMGNEGLLKIWDLKSGTILCQQEESESLKVLNKRVSRTSAELEMVIVQGLYNEKTHTIVQVTADQMIVFVKFDIDSIPVNRAAAAIPSVKGAKTFETFKRLIGDHGEILDMQLCAKDESLIAMATNNEFLKIYNLNTWDCKLLKGHSDLIICVSVYNDEEASYVASSSKDSTIRIWRIENSSNLDNIECVAVCSGHTQDVGSICFSKLGFNFLISGSIDTTLKLWKINEKREFSVKFTVKAHEKDINSVCVAPNDKLIASGSSDRTAKIWDVSDGACLAVLRGHKRGIWSVQFSSVDQLVASSSADATIKLWSLVDFSCVKTFEGHNTSVLKVYFLNHGTQLISSASDGLIKIWNIKTNECLGTFDEHSNKAWSLCVSKDEKRFVSGGADGRLVIWKDVTEEEREIELEKREEILLQEQELQNCLKEKKWKKALSLAIILDKPFKCYEIIKEILEQDQVGSTRLDLEKTLIKLREDQIKSILKYAVEWNTNTKYFQIAQIVFELILRNYPPEFLTDNTTNEQMEFASKIVEQFLPYTERHYSRLNKLAQQCMFIDFAWQNMKLEN